MRRGDLRDVRGQSANVCFDGLVLRGLEVVYDVSVPCHCAYLYATEKVAIAEHTGSWLDVLHRKTGYSEVSNDSVCGRLICALLLRSISSTSAVRVRGAVAAGLLLLLALVRVAGVAGILVGVGRHDAGVGGRTY